MGDETENRENQETGTREKGWREKIGPAEIGILAVCGLLLIGLLIWGLWPKTVTLAESLSSTTLPLKSNEWKVIEMDENHNSSTRVLELEHGWLVYRQYGFGGGMAFVPRPEK